MKKIQLRRGSMVSTMEAMRESEREERNISTLWTHKDMAHITTHDSKSSSTAT